MNTKNIAVIGLGYVGLPLLITAAEAGFFVYGIDKNEKIVNNLNKGTSHIDDIKSENLKKLLKNFKATTDEQVIKKASIIIICVPTPLTKYKTPDTTYIESAAEMIAKNINKANKPLVILESTTYPGTTEELLQPIIEKSGLKAGRDFYLSFSPERVDPGNKMKFKDIPTVVGGIDKKSTELTEIFYKKLGMKTHSVTSAKTAEMTKLLENIYRLVNISLINEIKLLCDKMEIDIWEVIEAAKTKPYGFTAFYPGPGVGGHCIPLDPFYLSWKAKEYGFFARFIELAGEINELMPHYVITKVQRVLNNDKKSINGSTILVLGVTYKKDISDTRESPALKIINDLIGKGGKIIYNDPYIKDLEIRNQKLKSQKLTDKLLKKANLVLILTDHSLYNYKNIEKNAKLIVDTRGKIKADQIKTYQI